MEWSLELRLCEPAILVNIPTFTYSLYLGSPFSGGLTLVRCETKAPTEERIEMPKVRLARGRRSSVNPKKRDHLG